MTIRCARPESVIFDFDFTLADSSTGTCECVNHAFFRMDLEPVSIVEVSRTIGMSLERTFRALAPETEWNRSHEFSALFVEQADRVMAEIDFGFSFGSARSRGVVRPRSAPGNCFDEVPLPYTGDSAARRARAVLSGDRRRRGRFRSQARPFRIACRRACARGFLLRQPVCGRQLDRRGNSESGGRSVRGRSVGNDPGRGIPGFRCRGYPG